MRVKTDPKITPLFPLQKRRGRVADPRHIASILEAMAAEYPAKSGRRLVLSDAAKLISRFSSSR